MDPSIEKATRYWTAAQPAVSAFLTSVIRDFRDRDDLLQDTAVAVLGSFASYDPSRPFVAWAIGVARNQVGLYLRRRSRNRLIFDDETVACLATAFVDENEEKSREFEYLGECLQALAQRARELCDLRYRHDLKPAAIAERLGLSANTVAKALQRVRDELRECIERKNAVGARA